MNILGNFTNSLRGIRFGHCSRCTRKSFIAAGLAWIVTILVALIAPHFWLLLAIGCSSGLTLLWFMHVTSFAARVSNYALHSSAVQNEPTRRMALKFFSRALAVAVISSTMPRLVLADNSCPCGCQGQQCCTENDSTGQTHCACCSNCYDPNCHVY